MRDRGAAGAAAVEEQGADAPGWVGGGQPGQREIDGGTIRIRVVERDGKGGALPTVRSAQADQASAAGVALGGRLLGAAGHDRAETEERRQKEKRHEGKGGMGRMMVPPDAEARFG